MNKFYEYMVVPKDGDGDGVFDFVHIRAEARQIKNFLQNDEGIPAKIIQRKYVLESEKEIR